MEHLIKDLILKLSNRKKNEMAYFTKYKNEENQELMLISSGKIIELDYLIRELIALNKNKSKTKKNYL